MCTIPCCCLPEEWGPYLSPPLAGHALTPATRFRLGTPSPYQLPDRTQAHPRAINLSSATRKLQSVSGISCDFSQLSQTQGQVTHALLSRLPLGKTLGSESSSDLHALGVPPTFVLSQDQTLRSTDVASLRYSTVQGTTARSSHPERYSKLYTTRFQCATSTSKKIPQTAPNRASSRRRTDARYCATARPTASLSGNPAVSRLTENLQIAINHAKNLLLFRHKRRLTTMI